MMKSKSNIMLDFFISLCVLNFRKQLLKELETARARVRELESSSTTARVELLERTEETIIIKRSEDDLAPLELTVNKRVSQIKLLFRAL